jgi:predicted transcriptional regulator
MPLTLDLSPEIETRLRETAAQQGQDPATFATAAVEEKLQRVAVQRVAVTPTNGAMSNAASAHGEHTKGEGTKEGAGELLMLDKALAGLTGVFNSNDGRGGGRLSEMSGADFAEDLARKHQRGEL